MIAAERSMGRSARLLVVGERGGMRHLARADLASLFAPGDLVVANDAATLPASLRGSHEESGEAIEMRLAAWIAAGDPTRFVAVAFGAGDHRTPTEERPPPSVLAPGVHLLLGPLLARIETLRGHSRLLTMRFEGNYAAVLAGIARHGRPIQYAHVAEPLALGEVWPSLAADPVAFEPPSAGFALDWRLIAAWQRRGIDLVTLTHAAGISSTGDPALDLRLPFDEPYVIPDRTASAIDRAKADGRRIIAIGTVVSRELVYEAPRAVVG